MTPSVTVGNVDAPALSVQDLVQLEVGNLRAVDESQVWILNPALPITPRPQHGDWRVHVFPCQGDACCKRTCERSLVHKITLLALVCAKMAALQLNSRLARGGCCRLRFCSRTRTFDPMEVKVTANCSVSREEFFPLIFICKVLEGTTPTVKSVVCVLRFQLRLPSLYGTFFYEILRWRCREHSFSGRWHSLGRGCGRYPNECWLFMLGCCILASL